MSHKRLTRLRVFVSSALKKRIKDLQKSLSTHANRPIHFKRIFRQVLACEFNLGHESYVVLQFFAREYCSDKLNVIAEILAQAAIEVTSSWKDEALNGLALEFELAAT